MYTDLLSEGHHHDYGYLILSGGKNRRMEGQVKLFMKVLGKTQLQRLQELIQHTESLLKEAVLLEKASENTVSESAVHENTVHEKKGAPLWISIGADPLPKEDRERYLSTGLPLVPDLCRDCGPMGGILSGLTACGREALLVLPSDLYAAEEDILLPLLSVYEKTGKPVFYEQEGRPEPFPGIYTKVLLSGLKKSLEAGRLGLVPWIRALAAKGQAQLLPLAETRWHNLNTPKEVLEMEEPRLELEEAFYGMEALLRPMEQTEEVPLSEALGRFLARDYLASRSQPPFDRSPLDGYAVRTADIKGASKEQPEVLRVKDRSYAGEGRRLSIGPGEALRIMTGAPVPDGADGVVMQEDTDQGEQEVRIYKSLKPGQNVVPAGEDYSAGERLLQAGERLSPSRIALLASMGEDRIAVTKRIRLSLFSTGDELALPGDPLSYGKIYDSNLYGARALLQAAGEEVVRAERLPDTQEEILSMIRRALSDSDMVITTGGVSVGEKDLMPHVLRALGTEMVFFGLRMKPGMPSKGGLLQGKPIFCLSGNPAAAYTQLELLIKPLLRYLHGAREQDPWNRTLAVLQTDVEKKSPGRRLLRGTLQGGRVWFPEGRFSSGSLSGLSESNCFIDIPAGSGALKKGAVVSVLPFSEGNESLRPCGKRKPFVYAVSGYKNTGKTTLMEKLIPLLEAEGLRTACIKHDGHDFLPDVPGTDSFRFREAGALGCAVFSGSRFMLTKEQALTEEPLLSAFPEADIILIEGLKDSSYPKHICRYPDEDDDPKEVLKDILEQYRRHLDSEKNFL